MCQEVDGAATLTNDVQYTRRRDATLRALYVTTTANQATTTVTLFVYGTASNNFKVTLASGTLSQSLVDAAQNVALKQGDKISWQVQATGGSLTALRIRVHLAPVMNAAISLLDAAANDGGPSTHAPGNAYPATGVALDDAVRGAKGNTDHPLTWGDMATVVQVRGGENVSPGMAQTLISTADGDLIHLEKVMPDVYTKLASVGVTPRPVAQSGQTDDHIGR